MFLNPVNNSQSIRIVHLDINEAGVTVERFVDFAVPLNCAKFALAAMVHGFFDKFVRMQTELDETALRHLQDAEADLAAFERLLNEVHGAASEQSPAEAKV